eukprot:6489298-Amphidinium_carterae.2
MVVTVIMEVVVGCIDKVVRCVDDVEMVGSVVDGETWRGGEGPLLGGLPREEEAGVVSRRKDLVDGLSQLLDVVVVCGDVRDEESRIV